MSIVLYYIDIMDSLANYILQRAHRNVKRHINFFNLHVFEWDIDYWPNKVSYGPIIILVQEYP